MTYNWYKLFSLTDFLALGLVSRTLTVNLDTRGLTTFDIFVGNYVSVLYADTFLPVNMFTANPNAQGAYAVYLDTDQNVWFGFEVTP